MSGVSRPAVDQRIRSGRVGLGKWLTTIGGVDAGTELRLRELAFERFDRTGVGPTTDQIVVRAIREGLPVRSYHVEQFFWRYIGAANNLPITLRMTDLRQIDKAQPLLRAFVEVVRLCAIRFIDSVDENPKITSDDVQTTFHMDELTIKKIGALLPGEQFVQRGGSWTDSQWSFMIGRDIHFLKNIRNIEDYLTVVDELRTPVQTAPSQAPQPESPQQERKPFRSPY